VLFLTIIAVTGALACDSSDIKMEGEAEYRYRFDVDLYSRLASKDTGNICFSPFSIHSALSMVYEGAKGRTARQMEQVLGVTLSDEQRYSMIKELMEVLQKESPDLEVRIEEKSTEDATVSIPAEPVKMTLDHPFMFILYHEGTNTILFMGRVADPS
jgi:serine protease inhibitor